MVNKQIGIVGTGIAGLMCGQVFKKNGYSVFLLDKGRRAGGRMSTRTRGSCQWDHGAQYFTVRDQKLLPHLNAWKESQLVSEWFDSFEGQAIDRKEARYMGVGGMHSIPQNLTLGLDVFQSTRVDKLCYNNENWDLITESGEVFSCQELVLTPPLPQVVTLLRDSAIFDHLADNKKLESVKYEKGLSLMLALEQPSAIPSPGCLKLNNEFVAWVADNDQKKGFTNQNCITVHATPQYAEQSWDTENDEVAKLMIHSIDNLLGSKVMDWHIHRWLYAFAKNPLKSKFYRDSTMHLSIAGDGFISSRVESAALSGIYSAENVIESLK